MSSVQSSTQRFALLSVSDKQGLQQLGKSLIDAGVGLLSTGGTAEALRGFDLPVTDVSEHTGAAEMMAGRVKTLHPTIHGGILGRRGPDDAVMLERGIAPIDFVIVNLYPFAATVARADVTFDEAIENIDIGGPAMVRAAAKNHASVAVVTDPADYPRLMDALGDETRERALRFDLAVKAFEHTAHYDGMIADYLGRLAPPTVDGAADISAPEDSSPASSTPENNAPSVFPRTLNRQFDLVQTLRYGENPHQRAAFYRDKTLPPGSLAGARLLQGKAMSYNNVMDADAALGCVRQFSSTACVIVKHANPCGVAESDSLLGAYDRAYLTDPTSAFGGIIAFNRELDAATAAAIVERQFVEVIIAPSISNEAAAVLSKSVNVRVLAVGTLDTDNEPGANGPGGNGSGGNEPRGSGAASTEWQFRRVSGGLLVQDEDIIPIARTDLSVVTQRAPSAAEFDDLLFAWEVARHVKSNAIVYARERATVGVGAGQMSRVYSARIAGIKAADEGLQVAGAVMASDAFFPFRDGIDNAAEAGIAAVIQPGGSRRDDEVIAAADEHGMAMVFTGVRHFRH